MDNWRSHSSHKKRAVKTSFRIKSKIASLNTDKRENKPIGEPLYSDNITDPGAEAFFNTKSSLAEKNTLPDATIKYDTLINQLGGLNSSPFRIDQKLLTQFTTNAQNYTTIGSQDGEKAGLTEFLHVKSVAFMNQEAPKKVVVSKPSLDEKPVKSSKKSKKYTAIHSDNNGTDDEEKKPKAEKKKVKRINIGSSPNQVLAKSSSKQDRNRSQAEASSLSSITETIKNNPTVKQRSGSESPSRDHVIKIHLDTSQKSERRYTSTTPKKSQHDRTNIKPESSLANRFGPLEKIKEITTIAKKTPVPPVIQPQQNPFRVSNNSNFQQPKPPVLQGRGINIPLDPVAKTLLNAKNSYSSNFNPISTLMQNSRIAQTELSNSLNNTMSPVKVMLNNQNPVQQTRFARPFNQGLGASALQQGSTSSIPNATVPVQVNQSQVLSQSIMFNQSTLNTRPAYPFLRVEEPKKKIVYVPPPQSNKLKFFVGGGNNPEVVKRVLAKRDWWEPTEFFNTLFNLKWQQSYRGYKYDRLPDKMGTKQLVNHFEYHTEISTKDNLIKNLSAYCEFNKMNLFELTPLTFRFNMDDLANFDKDMQRFAKFFIKHHPDPTKYASHALDNKKGGTWFNFDYRKRAPYHPYNSVEDKKKSPYLKPILPPTFLKKSNAWVLKPVGLNRGRGIEVFNSLESLNEFLNECFQPATNKKKKKDDKEKKEEGAGSGSDDEEGDALRKELSATSRTFVIQKYIEDTLLIHKRKFDVRVWVLVTHEMQLYFFKEGYLRLSSQEYSLEGDEVFNKFIHLTNNAVQKFSNCYGQHEKGNQLSFKDFEEYMKANNLDGDFRGKILPRMKELVKHSVLSVSKQLNQNDRKHCFEVFGYDFMIDAEFNTWLIEVNTNPCIEESSPLLEQLMPRMIDDAFKLTVDVIFPKPFKKQNPQSQAPKVNPPVITEDKEKKPAVLEIVQSPLRGHKKSISDSATIEVKTQPLLKPEEVPIDKLNTLEPIEKEKEQNANQSSTARSSGPSSEGETPVTENKAFATIEEDSAPKLEEVKQVADNAAKQPKQEETTTKKIEIFRVDGYTDTENMWEHLCALHIARSPNKKDTTKLR